MITRRDAIALAATAALAPTSLAAPGAQLAPAAGTSWPNRFVRLIVPFPPGGGTDAIARVVAGKLSDIWGQQMVVENSGGGATNIGTEAVVRSDARRLHDAAHLDAARGEPLPVSLAALRSGRAISRRSRCSASIPSSWRCRSPRRRVRSPSSSPTPRRTRARSPSRPPVTAPRSTSPANCSSAWPASRCCTCPIAAPGRRSTTSCPGRVDVMFNNIGAVLPLIQGGKLRGLAVTTAKRDAGGAGPAADRRGRRSGLRRLLLVRVLRAGQDAAGDHREDARRYGRAPRRSRNQGRLEQLGLVVVGSTPAELAAFLKAEMDKWGPVIKDAGISIRE